MFTVEMNWTYSTHVQYIKPIKHIPMWATFEFYSGVYSKEAVVASFVNKLTRRANEVSESFYV